MDASTQVSGAGKLTPAGRRILDAASDLFYREGIHAVGVEGIAAAAGVTKKTLYACFGAKDQLVTAYLRERDQRWRAWLTQWVDEHGDTAEEKLLATFDALEAWTEREGPRGCAFVNALAELPSAEHPAHQVIVEQKQWMLDYLRGFADHLPPPADTSSSRRDRASAPPGHAGGQDGVARSLLLLHEGVTVAAATRTLPDAIDQAKRTAATLIAAVR